jgi:2-succinyl-5-enolpyruvyl-6-hydroxy-3-cyclohexene-1-carboxylate synthase
MNPATALARVLVDELVRNGVTEVVLAPGSRNAPLAFALHDADAEGRLRLHVRIDERTAGFLALGLAKLRDEAVAVACTSGTAVANLHPAVLEASYAGIPLVVLTADRPPELRGTGANQAADQVKVFGDAVRLFVEVGAPHKDAGQVAYWRALTCRAVAHAGGRLTGDPGPVHLNLALRAPLVPGGDDAWVESLGGRPSGAPWTVVHPVTASAGSVERGSDAVGGEARTLVVVGDARERVGAAAAELAAQMGWPVAGEPSSGAVGPGVLRCAPLLLGDRAWLARNRPDRVLMFGHPTLSRAVSVLLADPQVAVDVVTDTPRWVDPALQARAVVPVHRVQSALAGGVAVQSAERSWARAWQRADAAAAAAVDAILDEQWPTGPALARDVLAALAPGSLLLLGSSTPIRDVDFVAVPRPDVTVLANRGLSGIDGTVSTAVGVALRWQVPVRRDPASARPAYALMGDLTFVHDSTGLVIGPGEPRPDLCIVVNNDDGGAIFGLLEQGAPEHAPAFERVFGTPHGTDLAALCSATATPYARVTTRAQLAAALAPDAGIRVVEVRTDRRGARTLHARLRAAVAAALSPPTPR